MTNAQLVEKLLQHPADEELTFVLDCDRDGYTFECLTENGDNVFGADLETDDD